MSKKKNKGFTIIEVLVSMVILAIGVLGLGILLLTSMQNTQGGYLRSQATILAYDIIDSMRVNIPAVTGGSYGLNFAAATPGTINCFGSAANCTSGQMATSDLNRWRTAISTYLPGGNGQISTLDIIGRTQVTVTVQWIDPYSAASGNEQVVLTSELSQ